jgi:hypothetical protein
MALAKPEELLEAEDICYAVRLQLHALAYNLADFLGATGGGQHWSLTTLR